MSVPRKIYTLNRNNSVKENEENLEAMYELFKSNKLGPPYPIENIDDENYIFQSVIPSKEKIDTIMKWQNELLEYLKYYHEKTGKKSFEKKRKEIMNKVVRVGVYQEAISQSDINLLSNSEIWMIVKGSQEVFKVLYDYKYTDEKEYKEWITWFNPVEFVLSSVIGYIYAISTFPINLAKKCIEKEQIRKEEERVVTEEEQKREEIKRSFYPFEENVYQNRTIQNTGDSVLKKQSMSIGPLFRHISKETSLKNLLVIVYGSDLWVEGLMNMISGYKNRKWSDFVSDNFTIIKSCLTNVEIPRKMINYISKHDLDVNNTRDMSIICGKTLNKINKAIKAKYKKESDYKPKPSYK